MIHQVQNSLKIACHSLRISNAGDDKNDVDLGKELHLLFPVRDDIHCLAKMWSPGCVNAAGKTRQKC